MPIESSVTVISDLNDSYPTNDDSKAIGANHLRNIKTAVKSLNASGGSAQIGLIQAETGATAVTLQAAARRVLHPEDFGAVGDGTTDDLTALTNFINALNANPRRAGIMPAKTYAISGSLPDITKSGVTLLGTGQASSHDVGTTAGSGTVIKRITNSGGTMLQVAPIEGASNQRLDGVRVEGISFNGNQLAAKGFVVKSCTNSRFFVYAEECTTASIEVGVVTTLGEAADTQQNTFNFSTRNVLTTGRGLSITGSSSHNVSMNKFEHVDVVHKNATGIVEENADNNVWDRVRVFNSSGSATYSIEWYGASTSAQAVRSEKFGRLTTTLPAVAYGTGTYTFPAKNIQIDSLDKENGTPNPTVNTGASVYWQNDSTPRYDGVWSQTTPTVTASSGTLTSVSATVRVLHAAGGYFVRIGVSATDIGTGSGALVVPLPFTASSTGGNLAHRLAGANNTTGIVVSGLILAGGTSVNIALGTNGGFPIANGQTLMAQGFVEA